MIDDPPPKTPFKPKKLHPGAYILAVAVTSVFARHLGMWAVGLEVAALLLFGLWAFIVIKRHQSQQDSK